MDKNMNKNKIQDTIMKPEHLVSIITASYNSARYLPASIESALAQTYKNWELIILDDASIDNTEALAQDFIKMDSRIQYFRQSKNLGIAGNRNTGFEKARGKYLAILDSDDMWISPEKLEKQVSFLEKNPAYGLIGTWAKKVDGNGKDIGNMSFFADDKNIRKHILRRHQFVDSSSVFSRQAAMDIEGYDSSYAIAGDYNFMLAIGKKYKFANIPEYMTAYRIHGTNITKLKRAQHVREHLEIIKKYRHDYPGFWSALVKAYLRILLARL
jgi:glycosyltransferase involved in cell wall biosynthesis